MKHILILLFLIGTAQAQIKQTIIGDAIYYRTKTDEVVFFKRHDKYFVYMEADGKKDSTKKFTEINFESKTFYDSTKVKVDTKEYVLTYNYSTLITMNQELINLFLNSTLISYKVGNGYRVINTNKYKKELKQLIEK